MARDVLDPSALGLRYAEVEALRRKLSEDTKRTIAANIGLLSLAQRTKLDALTEAILLRPAVLEARSALLADSRCRELIDMTYDNDLPLGLDLLVAYLGDCPDQRALEELP